MTLRELAAKTGKSTGVLDSASKKLLKKGILGKELVNDSPKLTLSSLEAVVAWVHEDSERTRNFMERREKDLQSFVDSLSPNMSRADIEHFEKMDGLEQAYEKLLEGCNGVMLHFLPVRHTEVEDPLRDFLVQFFRVRRRQGIITRVIAHDTPLGRRYQSRDPFEYRQTLLVPESVYAFNTEKVIAGDWVGTINHADAKALIIRSPEMAHTERAMFEAIWKQEMAKQKEKGASVPAAVPKEEEMKTRVVSAAREFFLSKRSLAAFGMFLVIALGSTFAMYKYNENLNLKRVQEKLLSIAATGALQFSPKDIEVIRDSDDAQKPQYGKIILQMNQIRNQNEGVQYMYILRPTAEQDVWEFVADADSLDLNAKKDLNKDGVVDEADHLSPPGEKYEAKDFPAQYRRSLLEPVIISASQDQWGYLIAAWAPIRNEQGETIAILGVDKFASDVTKLAADTFKPFAFFLGIFLCLIIARFAAHNRSLIKEFFRLTQTKAAIVTIIFILIISAAATSCMYWYTLSLLREQLGQRLRSIASATAAQINAQDLEPLRFARDMKRDEYQRVFRILNKMREENPDILWAYVMRPIEGNIWEFVVDADSNFDLPPSQDLNLDGLITEDEENVAPGVRYNVDVAPEIVSALSEAVATDDFYSDQWGTYISGYAPILNEKNEPVAIVGFDMSVDTVLSVTNKKFIAIGGILLLAFAILLLFLFSRQKLVLISKF